jgi:hypothetical protein
VDYTKGDFEGTTILNFPLGPVEDNVDPQNFPPSVWLSQGSFSTDTPAPSTDPILMAVITFTTHAPGLTGFSFYVGTQDIQNPSVGTYFSEGYDDQSGNPILPSGAPYFFGHSYIEQTIVSFDYLWDGSAGDGVWDTADNWTPSGVPGAANHAAIPGGLLSYPTIDGTFAVYTLSVAPGAMLTIDAMGDLSAQVVENYGEIVLQKDVDGATGFHIGDGSGGTSYYGLDIDATGMGTTMVSIGGHQECTSIEPGETANRCYEITPANSVSADVTFYFAKSEADGIDSDHSPAVWHWSTGTMTWTIAGTPGAFTDMGDVFSLQMTGVSDWSPFVIKRTSASMPTVVSMAGFFARGGLIFALVVFGMAAVGAVYVLRKRR